MESPTHTIHAQLVTKTLEQLGYAAAADVDLVSVGIFGQTLTTDDWEAAYAWVLQKISSAEPGRFAGGMLFLSEYICTRDRYTPGLYVEPVALGKRYIFENNYNYEDYPRVLRTVMILLGIDAGRLNITYRTEVVQKPAEIPQEPQKEQPADDGPAYFRPCDKVPAKARLLYCTYKDRSLPIDGLHQTLNDIVLCLDYDYPEQTADVMRRNPTWGRRTAMGLHLNFTGTGAKMLQRLSELIAQCGLPEDIVKIYYEPLEKGKN